MEALLISVKDKAELKLITDLLKKMRIEALRLTEEEQENLGLVYLMKQADRSQKVSRDEVMEKLGRK